MAARFRSWSYAQKLLLRDVSHELRSPLARLSVAPGVVKARRGRPLRKTHLDRIERETQRLNDLITQLLSLSYMEITQEILNVSSISIRAISSATSCQTFNTRPAYVVATSRLSWVKTVSFVGKTPA